MFLALGEAENETYGNNASGVFTGLFSPALRPVAPTEASPEERFPILSEALNSESIERKKLALRASRSALQSGSFYRMIGAEYQGGKPLPNLWFPKTYGEIFDAYRRVWEYFDANIDKFDREIRDEAVKVFLDSSWGVASIHPDLSKMVRTTIKKLSKYPWTEKEKILEVVIKTIHFDGKKMPPEVLQDWISIRDELTGTTYPELLRRYVGMDLLEDHFDEDSKRTNRVELRIQELATQAIKDTDLLVPEYSWLTTEKAKKGYVFGYKLGQVDTKFSLLNTLLTEQVKAGKRGIWTF